MVVVYMGIVVLTLVFNRSQYYSCLFLNKALLLFLYTLVQITGSLMVLLKVYGVDYCHICMLIIVPTDHFLAMKTCSCC